MIRETVSHLKDLPRYRQILATLVRYGYQDVVSALHLEGFVRPFEKVALGDDIPPQDRARRMRMVLEDLGPTFVKLGQVLSTRPDLLPEAYITELASLRDDVRPFPYEEAEQILKEDYGRPPSEVFDWIDTSPLASASISQVHRVRLADGRQLVLKIRRPGIEKTIHADLEILKNLALLTERRLPFLVPYGPVGLVREFERSLKRELDFGVERRTMERCQEQFAREPMAHIPYVVAEYSSVRVIAMEFIGGVGVIDIAGLKAMGINPAEVAIRGAHILMIQIFRHGFFHADPHPGNLRVLQGGVIAPLDYGMFGQLDLQTRERIADLLAGLMAQETDRVLRALDALDIRGENVDPRALRRDCSELVASYADLSLDTIDLGRLLRELVEFIRRFQLRIPPDLVLLIRSLVTIDGVGRTLDPHFDISKELYPFLRELALKRFHPWRLLSQAIRTAEDAQRVAMLLPDVLGQSLESIKRGELKVHFDLQHFENLVHRLTRAGNTLAIGIMISGLVVASAVVLRSGSPQLAYGGFGVSLILSIWLFWNMSRE